MKALKSRKSAIAIAALALAAAGTTANAELFQMEFTITYDSYDYFGDDFLFDLPANLTVTGTVVWDSDAITFSNNGVNSHYWEYVSLNAVGVGSLDDGTDIGFTITRGPTNGSPSNVIQTVHSPSQNASNMYWRGRLDAIPSAFDFGRFNISTLGVPAMPDFTSLLPCRVGEYLDGGAFRGDFSLDDENFNSYNFNTSSVSTSIITIQDPVACPADFTGDGVLDFFDIAGFLSSYTDGCP